MPVVLSTQSGLRPGGLAWRQRGIVRGCEPGAAGKYRIAGWANTWRDGRDFCKPLVLVMLHNMG